MQAEDLIVDESSQGQVVEEIGKVLPDICITIFAQTFVVEAVDLSNLAGFVIAAEDSDARWVANFESDKEGDGLD